MSPLYPIGKTLLNIDSYNETEKADPICCNHQWNFDGIMASNLESLENVISSSVESKILPYLL